MDRAEQKKLFAEKRAFFEKLANGQNVKKMMEVGESYDVERAELENKNASLVGKEEQKHSGAGDVKNLAVDHDYDADKSSDDGIDKGDGEPCEPIDDAASDVAEEEHVDYGHEEEEEMSTRM